MNEDVDIVFFGDSLTFSGHWQEYFPEKRVVNLGYAGDDIDGMLSRLEQIAAVHPEKIFIMAGINGFRSNGVDGTLVRMKQLIVKIQRDNPDLQIFIQSILPVSREKEKECGKNTEILSFNKKM